MTGGDATVTPPVSEAQIEEWAARLQAADVAVDYPWLDEDGCSVWDESSIAVQERFRGLVRVALAAGMLLPVPQTGPWEHPGHRPVQHRDGKPPWCAVCGWSSPVPARPAVQVKVLVRGER